MEALLEGKPIKHPIHPMITHFPIGLFVISFLLDLVNLFSGRAWASAASAYALIGGVCAAAVVSIPGLVDWLDIRDDDPAKRTGLYHLFLNLAAVALFLVSLLARWSHRAASGLDAAP